MTLRVLIAVFIRNYSGCVFCKNTPLLRLRHKEAPNLRWLKSDITMWRDIDCDRLM